MNQIVKVSPMSRAMIRKVTNLIKRKFGIPLDKPVNIVKFVEHHLYKLGCEYEVVNDVEMDGVYAEAVPARGLLRISQSTYDGACMANPRDIFTIAHEVGHLILHTPDRISFARSTKEIKPYEQPEWQANTFAGELLVHTELIAGLPIHEIIRRYRVSEQVAKIQKSYAKDSRNNARTLFC